MLSGKVKIIALFVTISERNWIAIASVATRDHNVTKNELGGVLWSVQICLKAAVVLTMI